MRAGLGALCFFLLSMAPAVAAPVEAVRCEIGAWRLSDGRVVDIAPSEGGLRWRLFDGTTGKLVPVGKDGAGKDGPGKDWGGQGLGGQGWGEHGGLDQPSRRRHRLSW